MITYPTDKLQKVLLSGGCEQRNLSSGYTQVEYLQSSGTQYIDTGLPLNSTDKVRIVTMATQYSSEYSSYFFGSFNNSSAFGLNFSITNSYCVWGSRNSTSTAKINLNTKYTLEVSSNGFYINNVLQIANTDTFTNTDNAYLFYANGTSQKPLIGNIYECQIWKEGVLSRNYIPCRRYDGELGMYDTVSNTFFTNAGTGTFTAGSDVTPSPDTPIDIVCNNGVIKVSKNLWDTNVVTWTTGALSSSTGQPSTSEISHYSSAIPVNPNTTYTITFMDEYESITVAQRYKRVHGYTSTTITDYVEQLAYFEVSMSETTDSLVTITFTTPSTVKYIRLSCGVNDYNYQLELGSTATPYMPYGQIYTDGAQEVVTDNLGNTANAERLLAVGDYKDVQEVISGSVTRNVGIKVLDGTEELVKNDNRPNVYYIYLSSFPNINNSRHLTLATHFTNATETNSLNTANYIYVGTVVSFSMPTNINTVTLFKQFLAQQYANGTPVIIVYPLATPTTEQVTPQPLAGNTATVTAGSIDNLPIESSTIAELKKRYIGDKEVKRVYIGDNLVWENN